MNRPRVSPLGQAVRLAAAIVCCLAPSLQASAQGTPWLPDRQYQQGPGFKLGDLELHPGLAVRGGYDSNVFRSDGQVHGGVTHAKKGAAILTISPHLFLTTEGAQRAKEGEDNGGPQQPAFLAFRAGGAAHYFHYFLEDAPHAVGGEAELFLGVAQNRVVGFDIEAEYTHSVPPFTENAHDPKAYIFDSLTPQARVNFRSRSQVLTGYVGYVPKYLHYKSSTFDYLNYLQHGGTVGAAWRFLPSTALLYDAQFNWQDYTNYNVSDRSTMLLSTNKIVRTRLGVNGALTNNIALRVMAGYSAGFYNNADLDDFETAIGEAVLTYRFDPHSFELGYQRDVQSVAVGSWYQTDRGYGKVSFLFARRVALSLEAGVAHANYGRLIREVGNGVIVGLGTGGDTSRDDIRVDGAIRAEYRATNWLAFMADFVMQSVITDFDYAVVGANGQQQIPDPADYTYYQIFGGVRAHY